MGYMTSDDCTDSADRYAESTLCKHISKKQKKMFEKEYSRLMGRGEDVRNVPFDFSGNQPIRCRRYPRASIAADGGSQQSQLSHLLDDSPIKFFVSVGHENARHEALLAVCVHLDVHENVPSERGL